MLGRSRRLDAACFNPIARSVVGAFKAHARSIQPLSDLIDRVFVPGRFKHVYGDGGTPYLDSADILEVAPDVTKHVLSLTSSKQVGYQVEPNWLLMPCSGQVYGNIGHVVMATEWHSGKVLSNHILRIVTKQATARSGYLHCVLGHPTLGRPMVVCFAFGSSVPELSPEDIGTIPVPRLGGDLESEIASLMETAADYRTQADETEESIATEAEAILDRFLAGDAQDVVASPWVDSAPMGQP
jgi:hypothetical protein